MKINYFVLKILIVLTGSILLIISVLQLTKNHGDKVDVDKVDVDKVDVDKVDVDKVDVDKVDVDKVDSRSLVKLLKSKGVHMLGGDQCSRTNTQRSIFDPGNPNPTVLKSSGIFISCDDINNCISLLPSGGNNIMYPEWVMDNKVLSAGTPLSLEEVYKLVYDPPFHKHVQRNKMRSIEEHNSCMKYY
jgi:hypothetical protein